LPPPPRKVIIERLAPLPKKPQSVIVERWLPYNDRIKRKVLFQKAPVDPIIVKPRNVIVQWTAPEIKIEKDYKYLGIIKANPVEYVQRYGPTLKSADDLPQYVLDAKNPDGIVLASENLERQTVYELEGDVDALKKINQIDSGLLDREGLSEYKDYLNKYEITNNNDNNNAITNTDEFEESKTDLVKLIEIELEKIFKIIDYKNVGDIHVNEATRIIIRLINRLGIKLSPEFIDQYMNSIVANSEKKTFTFEQFKQAFFYLQD
jgi:hypothetical protein